MTISSNDIIVEKKNNKLPVSLWNKLTRPRAENEDDARLEHMTKVILVFNGLVSSIFTLVTVIGWLFHLIPLDTSIFLIIMAVLFALGWVMAHRGHCRLGGAIPCLIFFAAGVYGNYVGGIDTPAMLLYALAIILAAILLDIRAQILVLLLSLVCFSGLGWAHLAGYLPTLRNASNMFVNRVTIVFAALASISLAVWFLKYQYQRSLDRVRAYAENTRAIFETVTDGFIFTDLSGKILDLNSALVRLYRVENKNRVLGEKIFDFLAPEEKTRVKNFYKQLYNDSPGGLLNCQGKLPDGTLISLEINAALFLNTRGQPAGFVSAVRDITQRKQEEEELIRHREHLEELVSERTAELKEAYSELESFSYSISHDLRSPLRRIEGFSTILFEEFSNQIPAEGLTYLNRIQESTHRMSELIGDLLDFSRLIRRPVARHLVKPEEIARSVAGELMSGEYSSLNVEVNVQEMPTCSADPVLLRQVYFNLLDNAFKYSHKQEKVRIEVGSLKDENNQTVYYVRDHGIGFDMQYAQRLFGVFQRLHSEKEYEGTGIGLATVQRIIRRHNGNIWVESVVNQGTTFYFTLGLSQE